MVKSGKTTLSSQFVQLPDTPRIFIVLARPEAPTRQITELLPPTPPERENPVRLHQSCIKDISLFYPPSFIPIPPLQVFSKISPSNSPQCQKIWSELEIRALRHGFLLNIEFHLDPITYS